MASLDARNVRWTAKASDKLQVTGCKLQGYLSNNLSPGVMACVRPRGSGVNL